MSWLIYDSFGIPKQQTAGAGGAGSNTLDYILLQDQQSANVQGGTFTNGTWRTRVLNTEVEDEGGHCSLASNQFTLAAGTYRTLASAPAYRVDSHKLKLYNISDSIDTLIGLSSFARNPDYVHDRAWVMGKFTIAGSKTFELRHECQTTYGTNGLGVGYPFGVIEIYAQVELWKEA